MKIIIKTKNSKLTSEIKEFIEEKINSLESFFPTKESCDDFFGKGKPKIEIWFEIEKESHHQKGNVFRAEAQLRLPGKSIRSEAVSQDLKTAITEVKDELQREIKQYKARALKASPILKKRKIN